MSPISVTTVIPVYSGKAFLPDLVLKLDTIRKDWKASDSTLELTEAIFVNDSSIDNSFEILSDLTKQHSWIRVINLSRNFGQHPATVAGILHSSGEWIVTLDEDLQHDPTFIESMLESAVRQSHDIVYANPEKPVHQSPLRDCTSRSFKALIAFITRNPHVKHFNSFRLIRGVIARAAASVCSHETYFDNALCWFTQRITSIQLPLKDTRYIESGKTGYTLRKLVSHARRMIVSSEVKVLRLGAMFGFLAMMMSFLLASKILWDKINNPESIPVVGWTSLIITLMFFGGLLSILVGIALEYITVIMLHFQGKPTFFIVDRSSDQRLLEYFDSQETHDRPNAKVANF